jgi:hypothetical protein
MSWYKEALNKESGMMNVPESIYADIKNHIINAYYKVAEKGLKRVTDKSFPPQKFELNLSGTQWEFLQPLHPSVVISFYKRTYGTSYYKDMEGNTSEIKINLAKDFIRIVHDTLEHEILHLIQYSIKRYKESKGYKDHSRSYKDITWNENIGGLPSKEYMPNKSLVPDGYRVNEEGEPSSHKRVEHTRRPIEFYPNLNSMTRGLQIAYAIESKSQPEKFKSKKDFFMQFLSDGDKLKNMMLDPVSERSIDSSKHIFDNVKANSESPELYKLYVKKAFDEFVNKDNPIDMNEIEGIRKKIKDYRAEILKQKEKKLEKEKQDTDNSPVISKGFMRVTQKPLAKVKGEGPQKLELPKSEKIEIDIKESDINQAKEKPEMLEEDAMFAFSDLEDGNSEFYIDNISTIPFFRKKYADGEQYMTIPMNFRVIQEILKEIKAKKNAYAKRGEDQEYLSTFDYAAKSVIRLVSQALSDSTRFEGKKELDIEDFYQKYYENA